MRRIIAGVFVSLDGVTESPETWAMRYHDDEMLRDITGSLENKDTLLLGRRTFEEFAGFWPTQSPEDDPFAAYINETPRVVVSMSCPLAAGPAQLETPEPWSVHVYAAGTCDPRRYVASAAGVVIAISGAAPPATPRCQGDQRGADRASV